ncbi:IclR family transcriptional regulator (plasmid) [Pseudonocardia sp. EC080610-09]|nr:IclR family transcriptional regulator [Pseudonocardia sp. EC080610-09]ALL85719.1 IclR family transcriptional regulator [Pseudonocardia sp. EC080619-01]
MLSKAFDLLNAFNANERVMTLNELTEAAGLPKSTVHRLLARLMDLGAIEPHRSGYKIGLTMFRIGSMPPAINMRDRAIPSLAALQRFTRQTVHFAVLRDLDVVYLEKLPVGQSPSVLSAIGARLPANCTAVGKALLAHEDLDELAETLPLTLPRLTPYSIQDRDSFLKELIEVRRSGLSSESEEAQPGLACVGAPIIVNEFAVAALSASYRIGHPLPRGTYSMIRETAVSIAESVKLALADGRSYHFPREF